MENLCQAHDCNNVIRGRRNDARYCTESCKNREKKYRKSNGITTANYNSKLAVSNSGNIINDIATNATVGMIRNGAADPIRTIGNSAMNTCVPYAIEMVKKHPLLSIALAYGGFKLSDNFFSSCSTSTKTVNGVAEVTETCKQATALEKGGGAAAAVVVGNWLIDSFISNLDQISGSIDTGNTPGNTRVNPRYSRGSLLDKAVNYMAKNPNQEIYFTAN